MKKYCNEKRQVKIQKIKEYKFKQEIVSVAKEQIAKIEEELQRREKEGQATYLAPAVNQETPGGYDEST